MNRPSPSPASGASADTQANLSPTRPRDTRVAFERCPDYDDAHVENAVSRAVETLGGWGAFVRPGARVLVKVNMLSDHPPEDAVTTHPAVVRAVVRGLLAAGTKPFVGDSPASAVGVARIWERTGIKALCEAEGVPLVVFEGEGARTVDRDGCRFTLSAALSGADAVVSLPKVKTHALTTLTCGVKNLYGLVPGYQKAALHKRHPRVDDFARLLRAIEAEVRPVLTIADGIVGMEGEGPSSGTPKSLGFVAASPDPYALDVAVAETLGIAVRSIPYLRHLAHDPAYANVTPANAAEFRPASFKVPGTARTRLIPGPLVRLISPLVWVRPSIDPAKCIRCGRCVASCPVKTLAMGQPTPFLSRPRDCIGCCCCHEMCPEKAIEMRQSPLLRLYGAFRDLR